MATTWQHHPMTAHLRRLARAPVRSALRPSTSTTLGLSPLQRLLIANLTGLPARFAAHEVHRIKAKPDGPKRPPAMDARHRYGTDDGECLELRPQWPADVLSPREATNALRQCRYQRSPRFPIACIARAAGLDRGTLYQVMASGKASEEVCAALTPVLTRVMSGELSYRRSGQVWGEVSHQAGSQDATML